VREAALKPLFSFRKLRETFLISNSRPWAAAQTGQEGAKARLLFELLRFSLKHRQLRRWQGTCFSDFRSRRKMSRLRRPRLSGFEPWVSNLSSGAIFDRAIAAMYIKRQNQR